MKNLNKNINNYKHEFKNLQLEFLNKLYFKLDNIKNDDIRNIVYEMSKNLTSGDKNNYIKYYNYCNNFLKLPITTQQKLNFDINKIEKELDKNFYMSSNLKLKILKYLNTINNSSSIPILCMTGMHGVGKRYFAKKLAELMQCGYSELHHSDYGDDINFFTGKCFSDTSFDECGEVANSLMDNNSNNHIIFINRIDRVDNKEIAKILFKMFKNKRLYDKYFGFNLDLSNVIFICSSNYNKDLLDIFKDNDLYYINFPSYSNKEKINIVHEFLLPDLLKDNKIDNLKLSNEFIKTIIDKYTQEHGCFHLKSILDNLIKTSLIEKKFQEDYSFSDIKLYKLFVPIVKENYFHNNSGIVNGLCVEFFSGGWLFKNEIVIADSFIGDFCFEAINETESNNDIAKIVVKYLQYNFKQLNIKKEQLKNKKYYYIDHSLPAYGNSSTIAVLTALVSKIKNKIISNDIAMTGAIDLHGNILPISGVIDKILVAIRENIKTIYIPKKNQENIVFLSDDIKEEINIILVDNVIELFTHLDLI